MGSGVTTFYPGGMIIKNRHASNICKHWQKLHLNRTHFILTLWGLFQLRITQFLQQLKIQAQTSKGLN